MEFIKNLKISEKLMLLVSLSALFIVFVGGIGFYFNRKATNDTASLYNDRLMPIQELGMMRIHANANMANLLSLILGQSPQARNRTLEDMKQRLADSAELVKEYESNELSAEEQAILPAFKEAKEKYVESRTKVLDLALAGKKDAAWRLYQADTYPDFKAYADGLDKLSDINVTIATAVDNQSDKDATTSTIILLISLIASLTLLVSLGLMISKMIADPIIKAVESLGESSDRVASASEELSAASQQLAEGSTEQAASIQETSATIEESASMIQQTTDNTKQAAFLAKSTKDAAVKGSSEMSEMMSSMQELQKSSNEIAKIIKVIDEIAFQTNILALNAAVEAARAGDAGKGFAVVAEEVRNLAQRCAQAAQDTATIIESNIDLSTHGVNISSRVDSSLSEINTQAQKVNDLLDEVAVASQEQTQGISQINMAITQMEQVIRGNATTAEQSAAASNDLSVQALDLKDMVNTLTVLVHGAQAISNHGFRATPSISSMGNTKYIGSNF